MPYFQGFVIPVKAASRKAYLDLASRAAPVFAEHGALRTVECWDDDVTPGERTDLRRAVRAEEGERIVFSWVWWPDKATCAAAAETMMADDRLKPDGALPFDGARMIYAGFEAIVGTPDGRPFGYVDAVVASVPGSERSALVAHAERMDRLFRENGALRLVDGWGVDARPGKTTDFLRAVAAGPGDTVVFGWIEWPDKATRDAGRAEMMADPRMRKIAPPWHGPTAIFGGFVPILDTGAQVAA
jgi:uncharacterized protein YbaA (DUF1428 family)